MLPAKDVVNLYRTPIKPVKFPVKKTVIPQPGADEKEQLKNCLESLRTVLNYERVERRDKRSQADWLDSECLAKITRRVGNIYPQFGCVVDGNIFLRPEEALFLMEMNRLELFWNEVPFSMESAFTILLENSKCSFVQYKAYQELAIQGFRLKSINDITPNEMSYEACKFELIDLDAPGPSCSTAHTELSDKSQTSCSTASTELNDKSQKSSTTAPTELSDKSQTVSTTAPTELSDKSQSSSTTAPTELSDKSPTSCSTAPTELNDKSQTSSTTSPTELSDKSQTSSITAPTELTDKSQTSCSTAPTKLTDKSRTANEIEPGTSAESNLDLSKASKRQHSESVNNTKKLKTAVASCSKTTLNEDTQTEPDCFIMDIYKTLSDSGPSTANYKIDCNATYNIFPPKISIKNRLPDYQLVIHSDEDPLPVHTAKPGDVPILTAVSGRSVAYYRFEKVDLDNPI